MDAGISFNGLEHLQLTGAYGGDAGASGPCSDFPEAPPRQATDRPGLYSMQAFHLYWDFDAARYGMRDPLVVAPDGSQVSCTAPGSLDYGIRYYCVVTLDDGVYSARVVSEEDASGYDASDYDGLWKVLLFKVPPEDYLEALEDDESGFQFHAGAIVVGGGGGGGSAEPDDVSTELREDDDKLQIGGWDSGTPASETSLADDLANDDAPASGHVVYRNEDGELEYKPIGTGPCRVTSVSNGSVVPEADNDLNGLEQTAHVTVPYSCAGGCEGGSFNIPVYAPPRRDDAQATSSTLQFSVITDVYYAADPHDSNTYKFYKKYRTLTISGRGVIKKVSDEATAVFAETIKHSDVYGS